jgi:ABC-type uncharacterized transport system permease subunit
MQQASRGGGPCQGDVIGFVGSPAEAAGLANPGCPRDGAASAGAPIPTRIMAMTQELLFTLSALAALLPASLLGLRRYPARDAVFWSAMVVAVAGPTAWSIVQTGDTWRTGLSTALWVTVAICLWLFAGLAVLSREAWRLAPLLLPYMLILALFAAALRHAPQGGLTEHAPTVWVSVHIGVSVITYGLVTVAAVAALAAFLQERALKAKRPTALTRTLPSMADCERLLVGLLAFGEAVLAVGLASGMAVQYEETGRLLIFDHKILLTMAAFVVIGVLLSAHYVSGLRGRQAARVVLVAYLLLTLGYPGVKFVTDVLLA